MSPEVDIMLSGICVKVKVTNGMSAKIDIYTHFYVETVRGLPTKVDAMEYHPVLNVKTVGKTSTEVDM